MATSVVTHPISFDKYDDSTDVPWFAEKPTLWWPARQLLESTVVFRPRTWREREVIAVARADLSFPPFLNITAVTG